ncbi:D-tyrosyl-tRNA(Tyr) deacylase [Candidatus Parcubacteria bacterium]|jgi:D-aminoacyl-tRNA deacylase|nr:D-tyrosyl-tRNA(Tyr) deacylase [Candidatus Parcubacteria bacterium]MBT3949171.1 D-tyrosyl-tRNA(Tyr) deacylase [Candidatus Parcubacteria bacterium]
MRVVLQRVTQSKVDIDDKTVGNISNGFLVLLGVGQGDTESDADTLVDKITKLRVFEDEDGKMNKNIIEIGGEMLVVSQFTLYANCKKGNRPSFTDAAPPDEAKKLYKYFVEKVTEKEIKVETGEFAAYMKVELVNDGPVTIILDS